MELSRYFIRTDGRLRAGWRLGVFGILLVIAYVIASLGASFFAQDYSITLQAGVMAASTGGATWLALRWVEHQGIVSIGLAWRRESLAEAAQGLGLGAALVGGTTAVEWGMGAIRIESAGGAGAGLPAFTAMTVLLAVSAATEETLFRGYAFQRLIEGANGPIAVTISSLVFGGLHAGNPHATRLSILNTVLAGVLLALAYLKTRALWLPIGFHFAWNWMLFVLGHPVSGVEVARMAWRVVPVSATVWVHGGSYGPEGGIIASAALLGGIVFLLRKQGAGTPPPQEPRDPREPKEPIKPREPKGSRSA